MKRHVVAIDKARTQSSKGPEKTLVFENGSIITFGPLKEGEEKYISNEYSWLWFPPEDDGS